MAHPQPDGSPSGEASGPPAGEKLQKVLAARGVASRRVVEEMIASGRVSVNGELARLGTRVERDHDLIEIDGALVSVRPGLVHYLLNKPAGVVSTARDPHGRPTVVDLVPRQPRVHPVGRLDADTEGLLLLTNDGELTHRLTHPSFGVEKEYVVQLDGRLSPGELRRVREGLVLDDGPTAPARASQPEPGLVRLTIHEGRNRQVRRMFDALGHPVIRLVRVRIGPITDRRLPVGSWRPLTDDERRALEQATGEHRRPPRT
jgi:23S rRNA pseudouridine2605 synthase